MDQIESSLAKFLFIIVVLGIAIGIGTAFFTVLFLFLTHLKLVVTNRTTLESMGGSNKRNFGRLSNLEKLFKRPLYFFLPIQFEYKHEGYFFCRTKEDCEYKKIDFIPNDEKDQNSNKMKDLTLDEYIKKLERPKADKNQEVVYIFDSYKIKEEELESQYDTLKPIV